MENENLMVLEFVVDKQSLKRKDSHTPVENSFNYLKAKFEFSSDWNDTIKEIKCLLENNECYSTRFINDNECYIPNEAIKSPYFMLCVIGYSETNIVKITSGFTPIIVANSLDCCDSKYPPITQVVSSSLDVKNSGGIVSIELKENNNNSGNEEQGSLPIIKLETDLPFNEDFNINLFTNNYVDIIRKHNGNVIIELYSKADSNSIYLYKRRDIIETVSYEENKDLEQWDYIFTSLYENVGIYECNIYRYAEEVDYQNNDNYALDLYFVPIQSGGISELPDPLQVNKVVTNEIEAIYNEVEQNRKLNFIETYIEFKDVDNNHLGGIYTDYNLGGLELASMNGITLFDWNTDNVYFRGYFEDDVPYVDMSASKVKIFCQGEPYLSLGASTADDVDSAIEFKTDRFVMGWEDMTYFSMTKDGENTFYNGLRIYGVNDNGLDIGRDNTNTNENLTEIYSERFGFTFYNSNDKRIMDIGDDSYGYQVTIFDKNGEGRDLVFNCPTYENNPNNLFEIDTFANGYRFYVDNYNTFEIDRNDITFYGKNGEVKIAESIKELQETKVELVEVPISISSKLMTTDELVQLTDEEFAIFENYENKRYVATLNGISIFFTPINRQTMDEIDVLILDNPSMWIAIALDTKQAQKKENPINADYNYLQQRVTTNETAIENINEQLGNINAILDEVNGEVI